MAFYDLPTTQNIITVATAVMGDRMLEYVQNLANNSATQRTDCDFDAIRSLYEFITQSNYRQSDMLAERNYQKLISQIYQYISLQPEWYTYTGGSNVIGATVTPLTSKTYYKSKTIPGTYPNGTTIIPTDSGSQQILQSANLIGVFRNGYLLDPNATPADYSFNQLTGQITLNVALNGQEPTIILYEISQ